MTLSKSLLGTAAMGLCLFSGTAFAETASDIALTHVRLIDGTGKAALEDATILFHNDKIIALGKNVKIPANTKVMDRTGDTVLPGLISDHSHIGIVKDTEAGPQFYTKENIEQALAQYRRYGVTTVTALGLNDPAIFNPIRQEAHQGKQPVDLYGVDKGIGVPDGAPPLKIGPMQILRPSTPEEARKDVDEIASEGTDIVKIWVDDFNGSLPEKMSPAIIKATINEAHKHHLRVAAHIHDLADAQEVVHDGADIIAHGIRDKIIPGAFLNEMKTRHVWYIPTLHLDEATTAWAERQPWTTQAVYQANLGPNLKKQIHDPAWQAQHSQGKDADFARSSLEMNLKNLQVTYQAGVQIGFGTDSGAFPVRVPGAAEHRELALYEQAGIPPLAAIHIATQEAAHLLGLKDRGVLATGKKADLLVVSGDPVTDPEAMQKIVEVWHNGENVKGPAKEPMAQ